MEKFVSIVSLKRCSSHFFCLAGTTQTKKKIYLLMSRHCIASLRSVIFFPPFRTLWRRRPVSSKRPSRGTTGTNMTWTAITKRRGTWTWLSCLIRRNRGWWVVQIEHYVAERGANKQCNQSKTECSFIFLLGVRDHPKGVWGSKEGARWGQKAAFCPEAGPGAHAEEDPADW